MNDIPRDERAVSDLSFLMALDPKRRDLAGIRRAAEAGDLDTARRYRDNRWLKRNPVRPGEPAPWVLDVTFGGSGEDLLETRFDIIPKRRK